MRATTNLSPISSQKFSTFRLSLIPTLPLSSFSSSSSSSFSTHRVRKFPIISPSFQTFVRIPISPTRLDVPSLSQNLVASLSGLKAMASFSSGGGSGSGGAGREVLVQHLLVKDDDLNLLLELQKRISEGEDMGDLAVEHSLCPSKTEGGMLGWVKKGQMVPEFEEAAFSAPLNQVVKCKTQFGWHLLQVLSEREELQEIQVNELHSKMQDPNFMEEAQLIDVREPDEIATASLPGFQPLPLRQFGSWAPEITSKFDPQKDTYVMCHHGMRSLQVAKWLQTQGFKKVFNVAGGIHAYALKADPSLPTY